MQEIRIIETGELLAQHAFFERHPTVQLPQPLTDEALEPYGAVLVEPELQPEPVPDRCTRRQGLLALLANGVTPAQIQSQIDAIEDEIERIAAQIEYEANDWERGNPVVQQMWATLGGTPEALDDLYRMAVTL